LGQTEVINLLKKNKNKWLSQKEIAKSIGVSCATASLSKLLKYGEILRKTETSDKSWKKRYIYKIK